MLVEIKNPHGLHARPCHAVVTTALAFAAELRVRFEGRDVNGKSILDLMTLNAGHGAQLELRAKGSDADQLLAALARLFEDGFGELP
jgi:phosphocarrier protein HPr